MKSSHLLSMIVFGFMCLGLVGCQTASKECQQTANPFPTPDPIETWRNYSRPNIEVDQVCTFTGQVTRGQTYKHQVTQNLVFCLIPNHFFSRIATTLPKAPNGPVTWQGTKIQIAEPAVASTPSQALSDQVFSVEDLDLYIKCPRRYYYEVSLSLAGKSEETTYLRFHHTLYQILEWIQEQHQLTGHVDEAALKMHIDAIWATIDFANHPFESLYRKNAEEMLARALNMHNQAVRVIKSEPITITLPSGRVTFSPDQIEELDDKTRIIRRIRTGKVGSSEMDKNIYGLYQAAANQSAYQTEVFSLTSGESQPINLSNQKVKTRLERYNQAILGILTASFLPNLNLSCNIFCGYRDLKLSILPDP